MKKSKFLTLIGGITGFFVFPMSALASCAEYPYKIIGAKLIPLENDNIKVISTYKVGVNFDDTDEVVDALSEGRAEAKVLIADLMTTGIAKDCQRKSNKISNKLLSKDPTGNESIQVNAEVIKEKICNLVESSSAVLKGETDVGQCYEPGRHVYVTIGIKPETIAAASELSNSMKNIKKFKDISGSSQTQTYSNSSLNVEGFSNFDADF